MSLSFCDLDFKNMTRCCVCNVSYLYLVFLSVLLRVMLITASCGHWIDAWENEKPNLNNIKSSQTYLCECFCLKKKNPFLRSNLINCYQFSS